MRNKPKKTCVGIDISLDAVRVVELEQRKSLRLQYSLAKPLSEDTFGAETGAVKWDVIEEALRGAMSGLKVKRKGVHVGIPGRFTVIRQLSLPDFTDEELRSVIEFEMESSIHLPFEEVVFDFVRCPINPDETTDGKVNIMLIAADGTFVNQLLGLLQKMRVKPAGIHIGSLAMYRVLKRLLSVPRTFLMVQADAQGTATAIVARQGAAMPYTYTLDIKLRALGGGVK